MNYDKKIHEDDNMNMDCLHGMYRPTMRWIKLGYSKWLHGMSTNDGTKFLLFIFYITQLFMANTTVRPHFILCFPETYDLNLLTAS